MSTADRPTRPGVGPGTIIPLALGVLLWLAVGFLLLAVAPGFRRTFDEFGLKLPGATEAVLDTSTWMRKYWWLSAPAVLSVAVVVAGALAYLRSRPGTSRAAGVLVWLFVLLMATTLVVVAGSLVMPWWELQKGLAK